MNIVLIGAGSVGQGLLEILSEKSAWLKDSHGAVFQVVGLATGSKGTVFDENGLPLDAMRHALAQGDLNLDGSSASLRRDLDVNTMIEQPAVDVVVEASPTNVQTGQPALDYADHALRHGKHVVLANKGLLVVDGVGLMRRAAHADKALRYEATVMAGTPAIRMVTRGLPGAQITGFRGILNGTTNYMLTQMADGVSFADALADAQQRGYAETDPSGDIDGWDAAAKVIILAASIFGVQWSLDQMKVTGVSGIEQAQIEQAAREGKRWKLIAEGTRDGGRVQPMALPIENPLANVNGTLNAIAYTTDINGEITLIGRGAGGRETGYALLSDLLEIYEQFF